MTVDDDDGVVGVGVGWSTSGITDENLNRLTLPVLDFLKHTERKAPASIIRCSPNEKVRSLPLTLSMMTFCRIDA